MAPETAAGLSEVHYQLKIRKWIGVFVGLLAGVGLVALLVTLSANTNSNNAQRQASARSDCKTEYSSILGGPVKDRDNFSAQVASLGAQLNSQLGTALLNAEVGIKPTQADVTNYASTKADLDAKSIQLIGAIATVNKLPTLNWASTNGFTFQGTHYPACPRVSGSHVP